MFGHNQEKRKHFSIKKKIKKKKAKSFEKKHFVIAKGKERIKEYFFLST